MSPIARRFSWRISFGVSSASPIGPRQLGTEHPSHGFGSGERATWEEAQSWQPMREAMEKLLLVYEWDEALVAFNLIIRPVCDNLFVNQLSRAARLAGDELDCLLLENLYQDCERHDRWTVAAMNFIIAEDAANRDVLLDLAAKWNGQAEAIITSGSDMIAANVDGLSAQDIADDVLARWAELKWQAGPERRCLTAAAAAAPRARLPARRLPSPFAFRRPRQWADGGGSCPRDRQIQGNHGP